MLNSFWYLFVICEASWPNVHSCCLFPNGVLLDTCCCLITQHKFYSNPMLAFPHKQLSPSRLEHERASHGGELPSLVLSFLRIYISIKSYSKLQESEFEPQLCHVPITQLRCFLPLSDLFSHLGNKGNERQASSNWGLINFLPLPWPLHAPTVPTPISREGPGCILVLGIVYHQPFLSSSTTLALQCRHLPSNCYNPASVLMLQWNRLHPQLQIPPWSASNTQPAFRIIRVSPSTPLPCPRHWSPGWDQE